MNSQKFCVWMITGGTTHAFCCLSACIKYAIKSKRSILPFSETHPNYGTSFYNFYDINQQSRLSRYFVAKEDYTFIRDRYTAPFNEMPSRLMDTYIDGPLPDSKGDQRYFLNGLYSVEDNERYLDYPQRSDEEKGYIVTWGRHNHYWKRQLKVVLEVLNPSLQLKQEIQKNLEFLRTSSNLESYIGVHFRNTDYKSDLPSTIDKAIDVAKRCDVKSILWATDDSTSYEYAEHMLTKQGLKMIKSKNLIDTRIIGSLNVHSIKDEELKNLGTSKLEQMAIFFSEVLMLSRSKVFIRSSGTVPFLVESIRDADNWQNA